MILEIKIKDVYGNQTLYPVNEKARILAKIAGTKTLTKETVALAKQLGFTFEIVQPTLTF